MNGLYRAAVEIQQFCSQHQWEFCIIGGLALIRWGNPRQTNDVDLTILTRFESEDQYIDALLGQFAARIDDARKFALVNRVILLRASSGVPIDISLGGFPFEEKMIQRASMFEYLPGVSLQTASAEDLIILKAFAGRPQDWVDIENVLIRQNAALDWDIILTELAPLCELKESPETVEHLVAMRDRIRDN